VKVDHDVAPSGLDAMLDSGEEPARGARRTLGTGVLVAVAAGMVAVVVLVGVALARGVAVSGRPQGVRTWIDQTLGPTAPEPPPAGAIPGISVSGVVWDLRQITGVRLDDAGSVLTDYARTGKGGLRRIGYETVTVTEDASTYDVVASAD
jgi:hypothetical protein